MAAARRVSSSGNRRGSLWHHLGTDANHPIIEDRRQNLGTGKAETGEKQNKQRDHAQSIFKHRGLGTGDDFLQFLEHPDLRCVVAKLFSYQERSVKNFLRTFENKAEQT
jgi:hypothetical protein